MNPSDSLRAMLRDFTGSPKQREALSEIADQIDEWRFMSAETRYQRDPDFHVIVDTMTRWIGSMHLTPVEMRRVREDQGGRIRLGPGGSAMVARNVRGRSRVDSVSLPRDDAMMVTRTKARPLLPRELPLLPGLRWSGKIAIISRQPNGYAVAFDAYSDGAKEYVFDRTILTAKQLKDWTGWQERP